MLNSYPYFTDENWSPEKLSPLPEITEQGWDLNPYSLTLP